MKHIYFIRHGETIGNRDEFFQTFDTELTEEGHSAAKKVGERLKHVELDALVAGPMKRTQQTAQHISDIVHIPIETYKDFHECNQPVALEGKSRNEDEGLAFLQNWKKYFAEKEVYAEGFENYYIVLKRVKSCVDFLEQHTAQNIAVVSHGAFLRFLTAYLLLSKQDDVSSNTSVAFSLGLMANTGISEFTFDDGEWRLHTWNDMVHFAE